MSEAIRKRLETWAVIVAILTGLVGFFGAFVILPYRMEAAEKAITTIQTERDVDRELLVRIDERGKQTDKRMERIEQLLEQRAR